MEYNSLLVWGKVAGLIEDEEDSKIASVLGADQLFMASILSEIRSLLESFAELNGKYVELKPYQNKEEKDRAASQAAAIDLEKEVSSMTLSYERTKKKRSYPWVADRLIAASQALSGIVKHPKRIVWTAVDEKSFVKLLERLNQLVRYLHGLMEGHQMQKLQDITRKTYLEMVQVRNSVRELKSLMFAAVLFRRQGLRNCSPGERFQQRYDQFLEELARLKNLNAPLNQNGEELGGMSIEAKYLEYRREDSSSQAWTKACSTFQEVIHMNRKSIRTRYGGRRSSRRYWQRQSQKISVHLSAVAISTMRLRDGLAGFFACQGV